MDCRKVVVLGLVGLLVGLTGCCPKYKPYQITVIADDSMKGATVAVHLVGINVQDKAHWESYSMTKYWAPGDTLHTQPGVYTKMLFEPGGAAAQSVARDDPVWTTWLNYGATDIFVLANLPLKEDQVGAADARRQIIHVNNCEYLDDLPYHEVRLRLTKDGIRVETPPAPQK